MANKMLIDASHPEETRVVVVRGNRVEEFDFESEHKKQLKGNIYLAKVTRVEPSLQAAFIEYGGGRHGFLAFSEIHPDYYQIPKADREALMAEELARAQAENDDDDADAEREEQKKRKRRAKPARRDDNSDDTVSEDQGETNDAGSNADKTSARSNEDDDGVAFGDETVTDRQSDGTVDDAGSSDTSAGSNAIAAETDDGTIIEARRSTPHETDVADTDDDTSDDDEDDSDDDDDTESDDESDESDEASENNGRSRSKRGSGRNKRGRGRSSGRGRSRKSDDKDDDSDNDGDDDEVDEIGSQDAMEEVPERKARPRKHYKIQEVIKRRQILLVQVVKEERGNKGAALTTYLSLAGRYSVLMPNTARGGGISRKITNQSDRKRLRDMVRELEVPQGMGIILRTAGANRTKAEIKRDYEYLMRLWESVRTLTLQSIAPSLVYEEGSLIKRSIRDLFNKDIDQIIVSGEAGYREAKDFMRMLMPSQAKAVQPYRDATPILTRQGVESQLDKMLQPHVTLKSGGYIIINQTEALVAIDVNSGRSTREMSIENTAYQTNLEAAEEIARQLRLRDLAGLIVVDFIDMDEKRNNRNVEKKMKDCLKDDRARIQVGRISHFGLMEMSRQRIRASVLESTMKPCPVCEGVGMVRATSSMALHAIRHIEDYLQKNKGRDLIVKVSTETALFILNEKRHHIDELEQSHELRIVIEADPSVGHNDVNVEQGTTATKPMVRDFVNPVSIDAENAIDEELAEEAEEEEGEIVEARSKPESDEDDSSDDRQKKGRGRRRRRGRRGGANDDGQDTETSEASSDADASDENNDNADTSDDDDDSNSGRRRRRRGRRGGRRQRDGRDDRPATGENDNGDESQTGETDETEAVAVVEATPTEDAKPESGRGRGRRKRSNWTSRSGDDNTDSAVKTADAEASSETIADGSASSPGADSSETHDKVVAAEQDERTEKPTDIEVSPATADERFDDPIATVIGEAAKAGSNEAAPETKSADEPVETGEPVKETEVAASEEAADHAADGSEPEEPEASKPEPLKDPVVTSSDDSTEEKKSRRTGWWSRGFF